MKKITRRQFLTSAGATSAALLLSSLPHAAAADENCLRKATPAATNSNDLSWDMAEEILTHISDPVFPAYTVNVLDYGAVPNDGKLDTAAIQRAIDETSAHGGGTVVIPSGVYDVGAITLKSNVNLHLESKDTILRFTRDITPANYPLVFAHYEGSKLYNWSPLIYAYQQENIALTGKGTLDGQADKNNWWNWSRTVNPDGTITKPGNKDVKLLRKMTDNGTPAEERIFGEGHYLRPNFYQPIECTNVLIEGVTIANSPMWELNPVLCTNFTARGVTIDTHGYNNDGCDPENCNYVLIENCFFNTGDDCIAVKAGRNRDGRELGEAGHPTQNLIIRNNTFADGHGGIACGSEMSGGIKNLFADNNTFDSPTLNYALRFKTNAERGGAVENIYLRNSKVKSVGNAVVHATMLYDVGRDGDYLPQFKNITIENNAAKLGQAVSLHLEGDHILVQNCRLLGNQDTVYTGIANNRSAFYDCYIEGTTDFIFGPGRAWFENCEIRSKANSYITAASSPAGQEYGYVFNKCKLTAEPGIDKVYLGRPWRPYAATLFMNCEMDSHIRPEGWHNWGKHSNEQTARYSEYNNHGSGAATKARVAWSRQLTKKEAAKVTIKNVFGEEAW